MPQRVKTADQIAKEFNQEILLVDFRIEKPDNEDIKSANDFMRVHWSKAAHDEFIEWLKKEVPDVHWEIAYPILSEGCILIPYMGHIAVVVSIDKQPDAYNKLVDRWENKDGSPKDKRVKLWLVDSKWIKYERKIYEDDWF